MSVIFLHPDLGIGGAERAVIDAAMSAKCCGYEVEIVTNFHDPSHAFEETVNGSLKVTTVFKWLPRSLMGRFIALCAFVKMILAAFWIVFARRGVVDVTIFYGHFPDLLLSRHDSRARRIYRFPLDRLEGFSTGMADTLVVNSQFTRDVFKKIFPALKDRKLHVLYPVPNTENLVLPSNVYEKSLDGSYAPPNADLAIHDLKSVLGVCPKLVFLSINRYERKKNVALAFESFGNRFGKCHLFSRAAFLKNHWSSLIHNPSVSHSDVLIVHMGGYDSRILENVEYFNELTHLVEELEIAEQAVLLRSVPSNLKCLLIAASTAVIYTPENEHFGIVPLEAMFLGRPVVAPDSGGPRETIIDQQTGFLCPIHENKLLKNSEVASHIAGFMSKFINDPELSKTMGKRSHEHVVQNFSTEAFRKQFAVILQDTLSIDKQLG
ncbi:unnamed protein product [Mesocestoides corti]|uniref:Alpha-1,3/1,6-mannosyltransferase ALG2 n=1 Tax=Mesocestoides corti TaxID=53468 RepID=A0A0R3UL24_MESCO|nr:unnamed protein product [Mesocestoides corti]